MLEHILVLITNFISHIIGTLGYWGVGLLMAIESAAIPLPSEIIMPFAGALVPAKFNLIGLGLAGAIGSTVGSLITYFIGLYGGRALIKKYGHWVFMSEKELAATERFFAKFGMWSTFLGRILPVFRTFISLPAGVGKVPLIPFTIFAFVGSFIWSYFLAWLGMRLGENWNTLEQYFRKFDYVIVGVVLIGLIFWFVHHIRNRVK
jgi:membrane protein DedA with SNARE-associated domain